MDSEYTWGHGKCSRCKKTDYCVILDDQKDPDSPGMCPQCLHEAGWLMPPSERKDAGMDAKDERIFALEEELNRTSVRQAEVDQGAQRIAELEYAVASQECKIMTAFMEKEDLERQRDAALRENRDLTQMVMSLKQEIAEMEKQA